MNVSYTPSGSYNTNISNNYSKPPRQSVSPSNVVSNRSSDSYKNAFSPHAERIISEQNKMLAQLQAQILELQAHVFNSTPRNKKQTSLATLPSAVTPNRVSMLTGNIEKQYNGENNYKEVFQETPRLKKSVSTTSEFSNPSKVGFKDLEFNKRQVFNAENGLEQESLKKSLSNSSDSVGIINFVNKNNPKPKIEEPNKIIYNPLRYSNTSPEPSPQPYQAKPKNESDNTICVPKIQYDTGSESSGEDEQVEAVERKYLYQS